MVNTINVSVTIDGKTFGEYFCELDSRAQAEALNRIPKVFKENEWCLELQLEYIAKELTSDAKQMLATLLDFANNQKGE